MVAPRQWKLCLVVLTESIPHVHTCCFSHNTVQMCHNHEAAVVISGLYNGVCRVKAGEWLGPWVLCHTLEAVVRRMEPDSLNVHVHVISQPGGAVPVLYTHRSVTHRCTYNLQPVVHFAHVVGSLQCVTLFQHITVMIVSCKF